MDYIGGLSSIVSIVSFVIFAAGVMKVFQMATTLTEIKDLLTAIKQKKNRYKTAALLTVIPVGSRPVSAVVRAV